MRAFIWSGPGAKVLPSLPLPADVVRVDFGCSPPSACAAIASVGLDTSAQKIGLDLTDAELVLAGFSAGYDANDRFLKDASVVSRTKAYLCFDSYYSGDIEPGVLSFAKRACDGEVLMVTTTSNPAGASFRTCEVALQPLLSQLGLSPAQMPEGLLGVKPAVTVLNRGNFWHLGYEGTYVHSDHAYVVAPAVCRWAYGRLVSTVASSVMGNVVAAGLGLVMGLAIGRAAGRRRFR